MVCLAEDYRPITLRGPRESADKVLPLPRCLRPISSLVQPQKMLARPFRRTENSKTESLTN